MGELLSPKETWPLALVILRVVVQQRAQSEPPLSRAQTFSIEHQMLSVSFYCHRSHLWQLVPITSAMVQGTWVSQARWLPELFLNSLP
jgi:hypothetical protein